VILFAVWELATDRDSPHGGAITGIGQPTDKGSCLKSNPEGSLRPSLGDIGATKVFLAPEP